MNDPSQTGEGEDKPDHAPLRDSNGAVLLPASSVRGALRSQAEKILRTIAGSKAACSADEYGEREPCKPIYEIGRLHALCPACGVFGAPGWRTTLEISDFRGSVNHGVNETLPRQEFLAIDRFTGGVDGLKFNADYFDRPKLAGRIDIDLTRCESAPWSLGLLALTLRDLMEGDIALGFGAAKGYGACRGRFQIARRPRWTSIPEVFRRDLGEDDLPLVGNDQITGENLKLALMLWVDALVQHAKEFARKEL